MRATRQQLRFETVPERYERQSKPAYLESVQKPLQQRLLEALKPVRGPVRAIDIAGKAQSPDDFPQLGGTGAAAVAPGDAPPHEPHEPPDPPKTDDKSKSKTATAELDTPGKPADKSKARPKAKLPEPRIDFWVDYPDSEKTESESKTTDKTLLDEMVANKDKNLDDHTQGMTDIQKEMKRKLEEEHPGIMDSSHGVIDRQDDEPPVNPDDVSVRARDRGFYEQAVRAASFLSHENNRRLDGLPPSGRQLPANAAAQASRPAANLVPPRADDGQPKTKQPRTEEVRMVEVPEDEVMMAVVESRLSADEKRASTEAKRKALVPWHENDAWRPFKRTACPPGTIVPMRFLLRYKENKPHARVILQGFKHKDVIESKLDTESPTVSRLGKYLMVTLSCVKRWKLATMDVKSAFLQSDYITEEVEIYGEPSADMRRLLAEMMGLQEHQVMQMTKPAFGDVRAPRQWNETADRALIHEVKLWKHELDGCIYMSVRLAVDGDPPFEVFEHEGNNYVVDGVFCIHVDDILTAGEGVRCKEDAREPHGEPTCYAERLYVLLHRFKFGSVDYGDKQTFCGCQMTQALDSATVTFDLQKYIHQLKPLNIEKARKAQPNDKATPKEQSQLRGLLGGLAWPANQTQPHLAASVSLAQAASACATVSELLEANKTLRYAKESSDVHLVLRGHGRLEEIRFGIYSDASWCTRPDGSSQGGWITFVATEAEIGGSKPFPLTVIDWSSRKLTRVCRSSLSAEAQTLAAAIDSLEWTKTVFALMIWPALRPDNEEMMRWLGDSPCITDARALFHASNSKAPGMKLAEKRTAIEIKMACERMAAAGGVLKWCNSHQQLADGVTKVSARQKLAMELRRRMHCLRYDPEGTASKKVKQNVRQDEQDSLDQAAQEFQKQQMVKDGIYKIEEM